jgi:hypothetical protein
MHMAFGSLNQPPANTLPFPLNVGSERAILAAQAIARPERLGASDEPAVISLIENAHHPRIPF